MRHWLQAETFHFSLVGRVLGVRQNKGGNDTQRQTGIRKSKQVKQDVGEKKCLKTGRPGTGGKNCRKTMAKKRLTDYLNGNKMVCVNNGGVIAE